jgi:hypothetical protein
MKPRDKQNFDPKNVNFFSAVIFSNFWFSNPGSGRNKITNITTKYNYSGCKKRFMFLLSQRTSNSGRRTCHPQRTLGSPQKEIAHFFQLGCHVT